MRILTPFLVVIFAFPILADEPKVHRGISYAEHMWDFMVARAKVNPGVSDQIDKLKKLGARITFDDQNRVVGVNLGERKVTHTDLIQLKGLQYLQELDLTRTKITGAGLVNLKDSTALKRLFLTETKVDDSGMTHLKGMKALALVGLSGTKITDTGLDHLREVTALKQIFCLGTAVTDAGAEKLQRALPQCQIIR